MPPLAKALAIFIVQFRRERPFANSGSIGFDDPKREINRSRSNPCPCRCLPRNDVGRCHKRVGAEINIQKCALRPFKQYPFPGLLLLVQNLPDRGGIFQNFRRHIAQLLQQCFAINWLQTQAPTHCIVMNQQAVDAQRQRRFIGQICNAHHASSNLVLICWANTAPGCTNLGHRVLRFTRTVQFAMQGQDKRCVFRDHQGFRANFDTLFAHCGDLFHQVPGVQHDTVSDDGKLAPAHDARWQRMKLVNLSVDNQRVACIVTALKPHNHIRPLAQPIDDLTFTFVAPLRAYDHHICHGLPLT